MCKSTKNKAATSTNHLEVQLNYVTSNLINPIKVLVKVNQQQIHMELDTGSPISTISENLDKELYQPLDHSDLLLVSQFKL